MIVLVVFSNVNFSYSNSKHTSIRNINFEIKEGEVVCLTGLSGSGKSTITKCLNGLIPRLIEGKLSGNIFVGGEKIREKDINEINLLIGSVFQDPRGQFFTTNTKAELAFAMENYGYPVHKMEYEINRISKLIGIENIMDQDIFTISSGERQKLSIACAFALRPKILLFDEPSSNLDYRSTLMLRDFIIKFKKMGFTVIIAEHRLFYSSGLLDKIIYVKDGEIDGIYSEVEFRQLKNCPFRSFSLFDRQFQNIEKNVGNKVLKVSGISFKHILKEVSFSASVGEIVGIVGANGVGKTTLAKLISKIERPDKGKIEVDGQPVYIMQDVDYQLFGSSVMNELEIANFQVKETDIESALKKVGLYEYRKKHPFKLSGGQKQRLAISLSYVSKSKLVIFDEPTSGLDILNMERVSELIKDIAKEKAVLVISHDYEFLTKVCNRVIYLKDGTIEKDFEFKKNREFELVDIFKEI